jgi:hypothetical protein
MDPSSKRHPSERPAAAVPGATHAPNTPAADPIPARPIEPDAADCCGEGCVRCIFDLHEQAMERYRQALAAWQQRHPDARGPDT